MLDPKFLQSFRQVRLESLDVSNLVAVAAYSPLMLLVIAVAVVVVIAVEVDVAVVTVVVAAAVEVVVKPMLFRLLKLVFPCHHCGPPPMTQA